MYINYFRGYVTLSRPLPVTKCHTRPIPTPREHYVIVERLLIPHTFTPSLPTPCMPTHFRASVNPPILQPPEILLGGTNETTEVFPCSVLTASNLVTIVTSSLDPSR